MPLVQLVCQWAGGAVDHATSLHGRALRNFVGLGLELADASNRLSLFPADYLGETERGRLAPGAWRPAPGATRAGSQRAPPTSSTAPVV